MFSKKQVFISLAAATTLSHAVIVNSPSSQEPVRCPSSQQAADFVVNHLKGGNCQYLSEMHGYLCHLQPGELESKFSLHGQIAAITTNVKNKIDDISHATLTGIRQLESVEHACVYYGSYQSCSQHQCSPAIMTIYGFNLENNDPTFLVR